jgi:catechol 2,3-dioxygenase-like lactoylglutathione lyase family enzyme
VVTRSQAKSHPFLFATKRGQNSQHRQILDIVPCLYSLLLMPTRAFNHVAVSVTDIDSAMRWYRDVIQMTPLVEPTEITTYEKDQQNYDPHLATLMRTIFGPTLGKFKICHMSSANGVGIELFQFIEPASQLRTEVNNFEYWKTGYFHIALTEPNVEELADKIALTGGKRRTDIMESVPGSGKKICFCEDPFGNVIEIYSHSYEQFWANAQF